MADNTPIEWTDATWNPITGCSVHSAGCTNCYAMKLAGTRLRHHRSRIGLTAETKAGPVWTGEVRFNERWLTEPLRWQRPRRIFVVAHGDLFHEAVRDAWIDRVFAVMALCPQHQFQVLTKRADRMRAWFERFQNADWLGNMLDLMDATGQAAGFGRGSGTFSTWPLPNVWLGVSVEDQRAADERIPDLLATPAAKRWISAEPLLGPVHIAEYLPNPLWNDIPSWKQPELDWIVAGGESGPGARPMHPDWARSLRDQCAVAGVPFLFKQWGAWAPYDSERDDYGRRDPSHAGRHVLNDGERPGPENLVIPLGKKAAGRLLDGVEYNGMPA